jgi:hypothetical protein
MKLINFSYSSLSPHVPLIFKSEIHSFPLKVAIKSIHNSGRLLYLVYGGLYIAPGGTTWAEVLNELCYLTDKLRKDY